MVAPRVIGSDDAGAGAGRLQRAAEIRQRERRDLLVQPELDGRIVERLDRLADLREQARLRVDLVLVRVESAKLAEEDLARQPERRRCRR